MTKGKGGMPSEIMTKGAIHFMGVVNCTVICSVLVYNFAPGCTYANEKVYTM